MIPRMGFASILLIWLSGLLAGRSVAQVYAHSELWVPYAGMSAVALFGVAILALLARS